MKKFHSFLITVVAVASVVCVTSCSSDKGTSTPSGPPTPETLENAFAYGNDIHKIGSVVYTTEEKKGFTTFYLSPTPNLTNPDGMKMADDYLKLVVNDPKAGKVDLTAEGVEVSYKHIELNSTTVSNYPKATLELKLMTPKTMSLTLEVESSSGERLMAAYYGLCTQWPEDSTAEADYLCQEIIQASYFGQGGAESKDTGNYYIVMTTAPYEIIQNQGNNYIQLKEPGYVVYLDLYATMEENKLILPTGTYKPSLYNEPLTYYTEYSAVIFQDGAGGGKNLGLEGPISVEAKEGVYTLGATFIDDNGMPATIAYRGELEILDHSTSGSTSLPQIEEDVEIKGTSAKAIYNGNIFQSASGMMNILIYDDTYMDEASAGQGGLCASVVVFNKLFANPKDAAIIPGTYQVATNFSNGSWMPGLEMNYMGIIVPMGTYIQRDDGSNYGQFAFGLQGTVTITAVAQGFEVKFDLLTKNGYRMKGSYTGEIPVTDESADDDKKDDGTSTLEEDHDMDLSAIPTARLFPRDALEGQEGMCGYQRIDIGSRSGWDFDAVIQKGDIFSAGLIVEQGKEGMITPGTYPVTPDRFPVSIKPGVAIRGHFSGEDMDGTTWMHFQLNKPDLYLDGHVFAYGGEVRVEKAAGESEYTFTIDVICVRGMHVRGTWTGRVINAHTGEGIACAEPQNSTAAAWLRDLPQPAVLSSAAEQWSQQSGIGKLKF